jgi:hypothetical protein
MTNADRIIAALRQHGPLTDSDLVRVTGIPSHQQVNQICRRLASEGLVHRSKGPDGRLANTLTGVGAPPANASRLPPPASAASRPTRPTRFSRTATQNQVPIVRGRELLVIPCSGRKDVGGRKPKRRRPVAGRSVTSLLRPELGSQLLAARSGLRGVARYDESRLLPAYQRYRGTLYEVAGRSIRKGVEAGEPVVILSGGYGLLLPDEPIGTYERPFRSSDWPRGLIEACLLDVATRVGAERIVGFCARSTGYAAVLRRAAASSAATPFFLVAPDRQGRGGAQRAVPKAVGEALTAHLRRRLTSPWCSSDGTIVTVERLR